MSILIEINDEALKEIEKKLGDIANEAPSVVSKSLNRTVTNIASNIGKEVRKNYAIKQAKIKSSLTIVGSTKSRLTAIVKSGSSEGIPLEKFEVSPGNVDPKRKEQLQITVKKKTIKQVTGAFIADIHGTKVFKRETKKRLPIKRLFGPSVPRMIANEEIVKEIEAKALVTYTKRIQAEVDMVLAKMGAR